MPKHPTTGLALFAAATAAVLVALHQPTPAQAYPEPAVVNPSWALDFAFQTPDAIAVTDLSGEVSWYWYMPYKVTNRTGEDRLFIPEFIIFDDTGRIIRAGRNVPSNVYPAIEQRLNNPLLKSPIEVVGKLLQGEDFAKESVAIWPASQQDVDSFSIFVGGLYGETQTDTNPRTGEEVLLRRTLHLQFDAPGDLPTPQEQSLELVEQRDVMR